MDSTPENSMPRQNIWTRLRRRICHDDRPYCWACYGTGLFGLTANRATCHWCDGEGRVDG